MSSKLKKNARHRREASQRPLAVERLREMEVAEVREAPPQDAAVCQARSVCVSLKWRNQRSTAARRRKEPGAECLRELEVAEMRGAPPRSALDSQPRSGCLSLR